MRLNNKDELLNLYSRTRNIIYNYVSITYLITNFLILFYSLGDFSTYSEVGLKFIVIVEWNCLFTFWRATPFPWQRRGFCLHFLARDRTRLVGCFSD